MRQVAIIGAGNIGQAIGKCLLSAGADILFWDLEPAKVPHQLALEEVLAQREFVFLCVPSWSIRDATKCISSSVFKEAIVISLAKGLERESGQTMDRVMAEELDRTVGILAGPMLAEELAQEKHSAGVFACVNQEQAERVVELFSDSNLLIEKSTDVRGVALCSVLKNIYAMAIGLADGLNLGTNAKGIILKSAVLEMESIVSSLGGERHTVLGFAGIADLVATSFCSSSRNFQVGRSGASLGKFGHSEGVESLPQMSRLIGAKREKLPLFCVLSDVILEQANPLARLRKFLAEVS